MRSAGWTTLLLGAALAGAGCSQTANLGTIGDGSASLLWKATFEVGNLSEWTGDKQGNVWVENADTVPGPAATSSIAHNGTWSGVVNVEPTASMSSVSYLFRTQPSPNDAYYSAWFFIPSGITVGTYLSLCHFRDHMAGNQDQLYPIWDLNLYPLIDGTLAAQLYDYNGHNEQQPVPLRFPTNQWVQLEVYLSKATTATGHVTVWQGGVQILDRPNTATVLTGTVQWDVGGASTSISPDPTSIYVDDAAISLIRLGPNAAL